MILNIQNNKLGIGKMPSTTNSIEINEEWIVENFFPIGSLYFNTVDTNPALYFGGTWVRFGEGKVIVGVKESDTDFSTTEYIGTKGEKTHQLTVNEIPSHNHELGFYRKKFSTGTNLNRPVGTGTDTDSTAYVSSTTGDSVAHNNLMPYITCYIWKRTQ